MEDDLNFSGNGRRPPFFEGNGKQTQFSRNGGRSQFQNMEDDLNFSGNGRQPQFFRKWKTTSVFQEMEDD